MRDQITDVVEFPKEWIGCVVEIVTTRKGHWECGCGSLKCLVISTTNEVCYYCYNPNEDYTGSSFLSNAIQNTTYRRLTDKLVRVVL